MTATEYKAALAALDWDHSKAAEALGIGRRTSQRYALQGAPRHIALALEGAATRRAQQYVAMAMKRKRKRAA